ncbi:type I-E CRISPR-associated protein Cas5/CasD [Geodermatophilus sp. DF01-2]|uniref:type I-E CRISPR-associated protein Cas5/CasD n=1 Tax=Geodermatophilus sp. DF01-2 TaxID=2559610 RepID=UPI001072F30F|nr:type I-E CRISPR-associated protein Cas5/CasD [Geodermatophilus sp. DF01_2]TFV58351.1 type I-E CRISPR-associated protein Cas5/CasD [Geodermatophilus sp. DF01_2]
MSVLLLTLAGPLQSWGSSSRFVRRGTESAPTKSGVLGLLAAAQGRRRTERLEDLAGLRFGVRIDQPGRLVRDFQTARSLDGRQTMPLSYRFYLADAVFLAAVEGERMLLDVLAEALRRPVYPLYLGRRSCPPAGPLLPKVLDGTVEEVLSAEPWAAKAWYRRSAAVASLPEVHVETVIDCPPGTAKAVTVRDHPISFDPERREYGWRTVLYDSVLVHSRGARAVARDAHDPMAAW